MHPSSSTACIAFTLGLRQYKPYSSQMHTITITYRAEALGLPHFLRLSIMPLFLQCSRISYIKRFLRLLPGTSICLLLCPPFACSRYFYKPYAFCLLVPCLSLGATKITSLTDLYQTCSSKLYVDRPANFSDNAEC